jgi:hypothetical protein
MTADQLAAHSGTNIVALFEELVNATDGSALDTGSLAIY